MQNTSLPSNNSLYPLNVFEAADAHEECMVCEKNLLLGSDVFVCLYEGMFVVNTEEHEWGGYNCCTECYDNYCEAVKLYEHLRSSRPDCRVPVLWPVRSYQFVRDLPVLLSALPGGARGNLESITANSDTVVQ